MLDQFEPFVDATKASEFPSISREYLVALAPKAKCPRIRWGLAVAKRGVSG